ncbi:MAG: sugar phosphate isomerase/epimerase [Opitutales bacterium]|nr:sugar phosphate isomerase/epimerase [Opitutales bacterium]
MTSLRKNIFLPDTFLLGTVALEPRRWKKDPERYPSFAVSEKGEAARDAGFTGWELWERHYTHAPEEEQKALRKSDFPVVGLNTYWIPGHGTVEEGERVAETIAAFQPSLRLVKFNLGPVDGPVPVEEQVEAAARWAELLPEGVRLLCECHPRTVLETTGAAKKAFAEWPVERFGAIVHPLGPARLELPNWLGALGNRITHLHWQSKGVDKKMCPLAELEGEVLMAAEILAKYGFAGSAALEFVAGMNKPGEHPDRLFQQAVEDLQFLQRLQKG